MPVLWSTFHGCLDASRIKVATNRSSRRSNSSRSSISIIRIRNCCCCEDEEQGTEQGGCKMMPPFAPYSAKVPWHKGIRALLCKAFPRYGNYCGPNYSSGRDGGSPLWDKPPVDWLDYCCLQHDIGYDTYNQAQLHKADIAMLECLMKIPRDVSSSPQALVRETYRLLCIFGLRNLLIPYRRLLLKSYELSGTKRG